MIKRIIIFFLAFFYNSHQSKVFKNKASKLFKQIVSRSYFQEVKRIKLDNVLEPLGVKDNLNSICLYSSVSGVLSKNYIPELVYYTRVEPTLNDKAFSKAYTDKNVYDKLLQRDLLPITYFRSIKGVLYDSKYNSISFNKAEELIEGRDRIVIKISTDSGGGKGVGVFESINSLFKDAFNGQVYTLVNLIERFSPDFICQESLVNHDYYKRFNPSSLNTVRLFTYRSFNDNQPKILHTILRIGQKGNVVDNQAAGGFACGVNEYGELRGFAVVKEGSTHKIVNNIPLIIGEKIFAFEELKNVALNVANDFKYARLLGLDLCVEKSGNVKLIEVNNVNNEINFYQFCNGPLFGNYTEEIIKHTSENMRSYCFDFYL